MKLLRTLSLLSFLATLGTYAQDYTKQFEALQQSIKAKNGNAITPFISPQMAIPPFVTKDQLTPDLLERVFADVFKEIQSITLQKSAPGEMIVFYDFEDDKIVDRASPIHFDTDRKIKRIDIIADLIRESREKNQGKEAEQPIADEYTRKYPAQKIEFTSKDNRAIVAELYDIGKDKPIILLCHQAGSNKYEYTDIAPKLNHLGFNALAVDLTGGGPFAAHTNETIDKGTPLESSAANRKIIFDRVKGEISAAIIYLSKRYNQKVIVWGSSYSASYAISIASKNDAVKASISFSGLAKGLSGILPDLDKPVFMTSSKEEAPRIKNILKDVPTKQNIIHFIPKGEGSHGSRVLWNEQPHADEYWTALKMFLDTLK